MMRAGPGVRQDWVSVDRYAGEPRSERARPCAPICSVAGLISREEALVVPEHVCCRAGCHTGNKNLSLQETLLQCMAPYSGFTVAFVVQNGHGVPCLKKQERLVI